MRTGIGRQRCIAFLLGLTVFSAVVSASGFLYLRALGLNVRFRSVQELDSRLAAGSLRTTSVGSAAAREAFLRLLVSGGFQPGSIRSLADAVKVQIWIGNQVPGLALHQGSARGYELLRQGMKGEGLACGAMTDIFREALVLLGVPARAVVLSQSDFRQETHAVVEAFLENEWRVLDPTFNVTYEGGRGALGVDAIQERIGRLGPGSVRAVWHGARRYPADLLRDAPNWQQYFASAYVYELGEVSRSWRALPPWRYWTGPAHYYFGDRLMAFPAIQDRLYLSLTVWLPVIGLVAALSAGWLLSRGNSLPQMAGSFHERYQAKGAASSNGVQ